MFCFLISVFILISIFEEVWWDKNQGGKNEKYKFTVKVLTLWVSINDSYRAGHQLSSFQNWASCLMMDKSSQLHKDLIADIEASGSLVTCYSKA